MGGPSEMNAPSEIFFCLFDTISGCLIQSPNNFVLLHLRRLRVWLVDFCGIECNLKPKLNYENKDDKKFKVVLRRLFCRFKNSFFFGFDS